MGVALAGRIFRDLAGPAALAPGQDSIYVGHDGSLDQLRTIFGITWEEPPFSGSPGTTPPNSGVLLTRKPCGRIGVDVVYVEVDGTLTPPVRMRPASPPELSASELAVRAKGNIGLYASATECARKLGIRFEP